MARLMRNNSDVVFTGSDGSQITIDRILKMEELVIDLLRHIQEERPDLVLKYLDLIGLEEK